VLLVVGYACVTFILEFKLFFRIFQFLYSTVCLKLNYFILLTVIVYSENNVFYSKLNTEVYGDNVRECLCRGLSLVGAAAICELFPRLYYDFVRRRNDCL